MKKFIQIGDVMFDPNLVQSVRRRYATCCIVEFENGAWLLVEESFKNVCGNKESGRVKILPQLP